MNQDSPVFVVILAGGPSAEAEVSRNSAGQIQTALAAAGHTTQVIELDHTCAQQLLSLEPDVVFPALHGPPGEDGTVQGMLEMLGLPYVGSDVHGSAVAMDKAIAKGLFQRHGLPVCPDIIVQPDQDLNSAAAEIGQRLGQHVAIKPLNQGSAIGVKLLPNGGDIASALASSLIHGPCLVEPFVAGREMTVGVLQVGSDYLAHPVIEIRTPENQWYDFEHRYTPGHSEHVMPAPLSQELTQQLQQVALTAHRCLGLRDLSRADFIATENDEIYLLEVNTLPGMTPTSLYPEGAAAIGYSFEALVNRLVHNALQR
jgi:D-alanine-D-alanine ligase